MTRPRPRVSLGTKRANQNSLLRPQAHRRSASEASLARHSPFTHPSLALHSETKKMVDMDQCTFGAVRPSGGRPAARRRPPQKSWRAEGEMRPFPVEGRSKWASGGRRPPSCLSPPLLFQQSARWAAPDALPGLVSRAAPFLFPVSQSGLFFLKLLFFFQFPVRAADADSRITAAAIPPRPDRQTDPGRTPCSPTSRLQ